MDDLTEEQARQMEAGPELNKICSAWYRNCAINDLTYAPADCSTAWSAAGPLLEAMTCHDAGWGIVTGDKNDPFQLTLNVQFRDDRSHSSTVVMADKIQLAIARACAVLAARGISRDELEN